MRPLFAPLLLSLAFAPALPAAAQSVGLTPTQIGEIFCISSLGNDMAAVQALLTPDFADVVQEAVASNTTWQDANPGEKPPLGDGLPWREYPDYADGCSVGDVTGSGTQADVAINYSFSSTPEANYTNSLRLEQVEIDGTPAWRISNVDFSSAEAGTMRQWLFEATAFH